MSFRGLRRKVDSCCSSIFSEFFVQKFFSEKILNFYIFYTFLLDEEGFHLIHEPRLGAQDFHDMASASSTARFSPDGKLYAFYNVYDGLILYDFDRETGEFSNYRTFDFVPYEGNRFTSAEFSSNSRFLYLSNVDSLWQVDLWEEDLNDGKVLIDVYDGVLDPNFNGFISSALAPDCKIYIRTTSSSYSMHVINNPNEKWRLGGIFGRFPPF